MSRIIVAAVAAYVGMVGREVEDKVKDVIAAAARTGGTISDDGWKDVTESRNPCVNRR